MKQRREVKNTTRLVICQSIQSMILLRTRTLHITASPSLLPHAIDPPHTHTLSHEYAICSNQAVD